MAEVVTFGEAMIRLAPPHFQRLEQARSLDVEIGGAELNTSVGLVRLGRTVSWVSRLPDQPLGHIVRNRAREAGVQTDQILFSPEGRCGLYFLEFGAAPRASGIVYDRQDSAISLSRPEMYDWPTLLQGARWFHVTGITVALSPTMPAVVMAALRAARAAGLTTSIDLNYRSKLWTPAEARTAMSQMLPLCDVLFASAGDAELLFQIPSRDFLELADGFRDRFGIETVVGVKRETPLVWRNRVGAIGVRQGHLLESDWYEVEIVDRLGAGDALASGVIHGLLNDDWEQAISVGAALGALKHSVPGDFPWITPDEVQAVLKGSSLRIQR